MFDTIKDMIAQQLKADASGITRDTRLVERGRFFLNIEEVMKYVHLRKSPDVDLSQFNVLMNDPWAMVKERGWEIPEDWIEDTVLLYKLVRADAVNLSKRILESSLVNALRADGFPLSVWTVNEPEIVQQCLNLNVLNITTRKVQQAMELRGNQQRTNQ